MADVETVPTRTVSVRPILFAGEAFGSTYAVKLPRGGVIAHPPGAGKTRIVAELLRRERVGEKEQGCDGDGGDRQTGKSLAYGTATLILCPSHLVRFWEAAACQWEAVR